MFPEQGAMMTKTVEQQIEELDRLTTSELVDRFAELHNYPSRTRHRAYLIRKIAWRLQANAEGDLTERARRRAEEIADDAEIRVMAPRTKVCPPQDGSTDTVVRRVGEYRRLPKPGSIIVREYKGQTIRVVVLPDGQFEWEGERYRTLTTLAKKITGSHLSGFKFFRLGGGR
jgi:hypothetical protein